MSASNPEVDHVSSLFSIIPKIITPPYPFEKAEYVSQMEFGKPFLALFTSKKIAYFSKKKKALNTQKPYYFLNTTNLLKI